MEYFDPGILNKSLYQDIRRFLDYESKTPYVLSNSNTDALTVHELMDLEPEALEKILDRRMEYTDPAGEESLREIIATMYKKIYPKNVLIHQGAEEAMYLAFQAIFKPGDVLLVQFPCYLPLIEMAVRRGCRIIPWHSRMSEGWAWNHNILKKTIKAPGIKGVYLNLPHNPTGYIPDNARISELIHLSERYGFWILCDEAYRYLEFERPGFGRNYRLDAACDWSAQAISFGSLSKSFGLPGLRLGWIASQNPQLIHQVLDYKTNATLCTSLPSQLLATVALHNREMIWRQKRKILQSNLALLHQFFAGNKAWFEWIPPSAGTVIFPHLRIPANTVDFCFHVAQEAHVTLLPGSFYMEEGYFRLGFGHQNLPGCLSKLQHWLDRKRKSSSSHQSIVRLPGGAASATLR